MLLEEGFEVTSIDASDKMLKYALKKRWERRKEDAFDKWGIFSRELWEKIMNLFHSFLMLHILQL